MADIGTLKKVSGTGPVHIVEVSGTTEAALDLVNADYIPAAYTGGYDVLPSGEAVVLATAGKLLARDVTVWAIPYAAVSNDAGGLTATIG